MTKRMLWLFANFKTSFTSAADVTFAAYCAKGPMVQGLSAGENGEQE
jgi:hypothetical protein